MPPDTSTSSTGSVERLAVVDDADAATLLHDVEPVVVGAGREGDGAREIVRDLREGDARGREIRHRRRGGRSDGGRGRTGCGGGHRCIGRRRVAVVVVAAARDERRHRDDEREPTPGMLNEAHRRRIRGRAAYDAAP